MRPELWPGVFAPELVADGVACGLGAPAAVALAPSELLVTFCKAWPKNPVGVICASPTCNSRHLPSAVMGSLYSCRRKRRWLVSSRSLTLLGYRPVFL